MNKKIIVIFPASGHSSILNQKIQKGTKPTIKINKKKKSIPS
jgi:hypothetical protein